MSETLKQNIQVGLRPSEHVEVALETRLASDPALDPSPDRDTRLQNQAGESRILAVISHEYPGKGAEDGCIFILKRISRRTSYDDEEDDYAIEQIFPIVDGFSITMAQPRRTTIDLRASLSVAMNQPRTELTLTITPGRNPTARPITLLTNDTQGLRALLAECKRLREASVSLAAVDAANHFLWASLYASHRGPPTSSPPPDLREQRRPLLSRLSAASAGIPGDESFDVDLIREEWIRRRVREDLLVKYDERTQLRVRIGTFNVNGKMPSQDLSSWVGGHETGTSLIPPLKDFSPLSIGEVGRSLMEQHITLTEDKGEEHPMSSDLHTIASLPVSSCPEVSPAISSRATLATSSSTKVPLDEGEHQADPDVLVFGFQELDLSAEALLYSTKTVREDAWCVAIFAGLGEKAVLYEKLASKQLVGMLLVVIVKKRLKAQFGDIKTSSVGAGLMGVMGNKGATAARLTFTPSSSAQAPRPRPVVLTFVNSHLAAFDEMWEKRNADFHDLSKRLVFESTSVADAATTQGVGYPSPPASLSVFESDALFWMVYLNYRINLPDTDIRSLLASKLKQRDLDILQQHDQLTLAMATALAFEGFSETRISHPPSYRFGSGVVVDQLGYDTKRKPAWTDRILHMAVSPLDVKQVAYTSHPQITMSDHRPVSAEFHIRLPVIDRSQHESFVQGLWHMVEGIENTDAVPKIRLSSTAVDFGKISYRRRVARSLTLENVGKVACTYRFVAAVSGASVQPAWLDIDHAAGLILPGEATSVTISAFVDNTTAAQLNVGPSRLEDTLILHTALGKDHFILVTGEYQRTCFATDLAWLVRLPGPVRALRTAEDLLPEADAVTAPREIMRLVNWLMSHATDAGLFVTAGEEALVEAIRENLDTGADFELPYPENDERVAIAFAHTLLQLLLSLLEPVVPWHVHNRCMQVTSKDEAYEVLDDFPSASVNVYISVTAYLHFIGQQPKTKPNMDERVAIFTSVLLRDKPDTPQSISIMGKRNFVRYFVES
ncbi:DNase I-like protein [Obba rivulosa]|uniref:DNase I-like protein n=1 Tax=Obba rivulosa TaxID=1052685 RepID=A0A8E2DS27_9APHY|nr:DNase I-like protein [Obba rivulosa]